MTDEYSYIKNYILDKLTKCEKFEWQLQQQKEKKIYSEEQIKEMQQIINNIKEGLNQIQVQDLTQLKDVQREYKKIISKEIQRVNELYDSIKMIISWINVFYYSGDYK